MAEAKLPDGIGPVVPGDALTLARAAWPRLYAGTPVVTLRQAAGLRRTPDATRGCDAAFAATAYMLDSF